MCFFVAPTVAISYIYIYIFTLIHNARVTSLQIFDGYPKLPMPMDNVQNRFGGFGSPTDLQDGEKGYITWTFQILSREHAGNKDPPPLSLAIRPKVVSSQWPNDSCYWTAGRRFATSAGSAWTPRPWGTSPSCAPW